VGDQIVNYVFSFCFRYTVQDTSYDFTVVVVKLHFLIDSRLQQLDVFLIQDFTRSMDAK